MMNHGRKLLSLLLALMLLLGMAQGVAFAAGTTVTLVPSTTQALKPGDSFTITAKISANTGYHSVAFPITFDTSVFSCTGFVKRGYAFGYGSSSHNTEKSYGAYINLALTDADETNDDLFLMNLTVKDNAAAGSYSIGIDNTKSDFKFNKQEGGYGSTTFVPLNASFVPASITVEANQPTEPTIVPVSGISLDKQSLSLTVGGSATLTATVTPDNATDKTVVWSSSNSSVASVENGVVTAKVAGQAIITAKAGSQTATAVVNVSQPAAPVAGNHADIDFNGNDATANPGDTVAFNIYVDNHDAASKYNSYEFNLSYDTSRLTYSGVGSSVSKEDCAGKESNGSITVNGYGDEKTTSGERSIVSVMFTVKDDAAVGAANVAITKAYSGTSARAVNHDIDEINIGTATATVTVEEEAPEYTVTFDQNVTINSESKNSATVASGYSLTFFVVERSGYTATVKVDGTPLTANTNGSYTIANITRDTSVAISYTANVYKVTVTGSGASDVTAASTATHGQAYSFTVTKDDGYNYTVSVAVGGNIVSAAETNGSYTVAADKVTGDIAITVTREAKTPVAQKQTVTIYKNGASASTAEATKGQPYSFTAESGYVIYKVTMNGAPSSEFSASAVSIASVTGDIAIYMGQSYTVTMPADNTVTGATSANYGSDYSFTLADGYTATVTVGSATVTPSESNGAYTIAGDSITGNITITTQKISYADSVDVYDYLKIENGATIQLIVARASNLATGELLQYNHQNMFYSSKYQGYAYLVVVGANDTLLTNQTAAANITKATAEATQLAYTGDVNMSNKIDVNDAQLVYDLYKGLYSDFTTVSMDRMLRADMDGNHSITVADVTAVVAVVRK